MAPAAGAQPPASNLAVAPKNPLQIPTALIFAVLIVVISIVSAWVKGTFGESGILALSAVVGLTDIDPFVLNIAQGGIAGMSRRELERRGADRGVVEQCRQGGLRRRFRRQAAARRPAIMLLVLSLFGLVAAAHLCRARLASTPSGNETKRPWAPALRTGTAQERPWRAR